MNQIVTKAMTHGGKFHADDVFSSALLKILNPEIKIIRGFVIPEQFDGIVFDIGMGEFDHHQENADVRENGTPYAAFGLLWRAFGEQVLKNAGCDERYLANEVQVFDESFVQPLDEDDNTGSGNQLASVIGNFNPSWDSDESSDSAFERAVEFAKTILERKIESTTSILRATSLVEQALSQAQDGMVILPQFAPWKMVLCHSENAQFVIYPSQRGGYTAQIVPASGGIEREKISFPESWAGKTEDELQALTGIKTLSFCHKGRFLISADTLEDILAACALARQIQEENKGETQNS